MVKFKTVGTFTSPIEAHLAKGRLETEGISTFIAHENHVWANWMYSHALGGVKVQVLAEDYDEAVTVISKHVNGEYETDLELSADISGTNSCPTCGSRNFKSEVSLLAKLLVILSFGLLGLIYPPRKVIHKCNECENGWKH